ncbi:hypothetical protein ACFYPN_17000 [Streptomyces sp. NPDC005576]|uniref:hypothetical protein n=1 Tax=Streptomyces sp. NPDC005576 TaxID=3364726 RepID=UPI0036B356B2
MATSESAAAGAQSGTPGSPVPRAAAVTVLAEEPSTGLFPAKPAAGAAPAPAAGGTPATVSGSAAPAATEGGGRSGMEEPLRAAAEEQPGAGTETEERPEAETEPEAAPAAGSAVPAAATAAATSTAASAKSATAKATAAATGGATGTRRTGVLPLGRPGKPLIAAAVAGGLVLVGVPFLISGLSGSGDNSSTPTALTPAGSRMGPDGSGPGFVPGRQNAPGDNRQKSDGKPAAGSAAGSSGTGGSGTGGAATDALHETGTKGLPAGSTAKPRSTGTESTGTESTGSGKDTGSAPADAPAATQDSAAKPVAPPQKPVAAVTYSHFIGPGCDTPGFATSDQYRDGLKGWVGSTGSQTSYGCSGFYYSVPLSNSTTTSTGYAQWKFPTGSVTNGTCQVSVYIPNVKDISRVGGNPAHYAVHRYFQAKPSTQIGSFDIDQPSHLGQWINAGTFPVSTGKISVVLENRGKTSGNRHAAAAPVKVNCTAT